LIPKIIFIVSLLSLPFVLKGQSISDSLLSSQIESIINHIPSDKTKLIFLRDGGVSVDSSSFRKVTCSGKEQIKITLPDYSFKKVNASGFWGLVNDFGQCQRFYNGKTYIVWHSKKPYVYRDYASSDRKINYFYSENLVSEIIPLTKENLNEIADSNTIQLLSAYLKTHDIEKSKDGGPSLPPGVRVFSDEEQTLLSDFILFHVQIAWTIAEVLMRTAK